MLEYSENIVELKKYMQTLPEEQKDVISLLQDTLSNLNATQDELCHLCRKSGSTISCNKCWWKC